MRLPSVIVPVLSSSSTSTSPAASTARPLMAMTLRCSTRSMPAMPMALSKPPMVVGNQANQQRDQHRHGEISAGVDAERFQRHAHEQEDERQRREQNRQRDFVRRLLPLRAFDQRDHAVQEAVALFHRDADDDAVAEHARAAGDGAAVAAALADDRRGFAGDGGLVHAGDAFDHLAVGGDHVAGFARRRGRLCCNSGAGTFSSRPSRSRRAMVSLAGLAQAVGLRLAAAFGHGFGEVGEQHGEPEPDGELRDEAALGRAR